MHAIPLLIGGELGRRRQGLQKAGISDLSHSAVFLHPLSWDHVQAKSGTIAKLESPSTPFTRDAPPRCRFALPPALGPGSLGFHSDVTVITRHFFFPSPPSFFGSTSKPEATSRLPRLSSVGSSELPVHRERKTAPTVFCDAEAKLNPASFGARPEETTPRSSWRGGHREQSQATAVLPGGEGDGTEQHEFRNIDRRWHSRRMSSACFLFLSAPLEP